MHISLQKAKRPFCLYAFGKEANEMGTRFGNKATVFSGLRIDREELHQKRERLFKWLVLITPVAFLFLAGSKALSSAGELARQQYAVAQPEYFESLPSSVKSSMQQAKSFGFAIISPVFTPEVQYWADDIARWAQLYQLDPNLIATVMQIESCGNARVESPSGALGLFQVMPFHFGYDEDGLDIETNARRGLTYLRGGLDLADGDFRLAIAGYNGGHGVIDLDSTLWPAETQRYTYWGFGILDDIASGESASSRLNEWLSNGGASLCQGASRSLGMN